MIAGDFVSLNSQSVANILQRGGTILKSARSQDFMTPKGRKKAYPYLACPVIEGVVAIGVEGNFTGANLFNPEFEVPFIGIPGTIENDLFGTDNTIGYETALNTEIYF